MPEEGPRIYFLSGPLASRFKGWGKSPPAWAEFSASHFAIFHSSIILSRLNPSLMRTHSLLK
jgi:hypothetical protein